MRELVFKGQLKGHKAVVVGCGRSGRAAVNLLVALGADVCLVEKNKNKISSTILDWVEEKNVKLILGEYKKSHFKGANLVVLSPGVPLNRIRSFVPSNAFICSELELASWFVDKPIIAITGTNGKTTTTLLIAHVLKQAGKKVFAGGNLGVPLSEYVLGGEQVDFLILEVSSFQLQGCNSFRPQVAILLNFSPNHLDFHLTEEEYWEAKIKLFIKQKQNDIGIFPLELKPKIEELNLSCSRVYFIPSNRFQHEFLIGEHNQANMEAAFLALRYIGFSEQDFAEYSKDFRPPEHRMEFFWKWKNIAFVNDSKSTTVASLKAALESVNNPIRLLCGGIFKGGDLKELRDIVKNKVKKIYLFGESKDIFQNSLNGCCPIRWFETLEDVFKELREDLLKEGDSEVVMLSPATSSFDLFKDYKDRGNKFKMLVRKYFENGQQL